MSVLSCGITYQHMSMGAVAGTTKRHHIGLLRIGLAGAMTQIRLSSCCRCCSISTHATVQAGNPSTSLQKQAVTNSCALHIAAQAATFQPNTLARSNTLSQCKAYKQTQTALHTCTHHSALALTPNKTTHIQLHAGPHLPALQSAQYCYGPALNWIWLGGRQPTKLLVVMIRFCHT